MISYVIGDVHGCYNELCRLEEHLYAHAAEREDIAFLIMVGDLVDRGPHSKKVISHIREGISEKRIESVKGNHDDICVKSLSPFLLTPSASINKDLLSHWLLNLGGENTLYSYGLKKFPRDVEMFPVDDLSLLLERPLIFETEDTIVSHALCSLAAYRAYKNKETLLDTFYENILWERVLPQGLLSKEKIHVSGHSVVENVCYHATERRLQIDTGLVFGGMLSAFCCQTREFFMISHGEREVLCIQWPFQ